MYYMSKDAEKWFTKNNSPELTCISNIPKSNYKKGDIIKFNGREYKVTDVKPGNNTTVYFEPIKEE